MDSPLFAQPRSVITLPDMSAYIALMNQFEVPYQSWKAGKFEKLWAEVVHGDAVYTTLYDLVGEARARVLGRTNMPLRFIITVAAWVFLEREGERFVLVERTFDPDSNEYVARKHDGSMSEKVLLDPNTGKPIESQARTLQRGLGEEARIDGVSERTIRRGLFFDAHPSKAPLIGSARHVEQDSREKTDTLGIWTFNQIAHYRAKLPSRAYFSGFRQDRATRYLSRWNSTRDEVSLEPIPADLVLTTR